MMVNLEISHEELIEKYITWVKKGAATRRSALRYFFGERRQVPQKDEKTLIHEWEILHPKPEEKRKLKIWTKERRAFIESIKPCFGYNKHIFEISRDDIEEYFIWLRDLKVTSVKTRKTKWAIFSSFLNYLRQKVDDFNPKVIKVNANAWSAAEDKDEEAFGEVRSNSGIYASKEEIQSILNYFKVHDFRTYIIMRLFVETGCRKGELIEAKVKDVNIEDRYFYPKKGKTGKKVYFFSDGFKPYLSLYLEERKSMETESKYLFLSQWGNINCQRTFNKRLAAARKELGITNRITTKTFRKTLNNFRRLMGCPNEDRAILIGHSLGAHPELSAVNYENYTQKILENKDYMIKIYDKYFPYKNLNL